MAITHLTGWFRGSWRGLAITAIATIAVILSTGGPALPKSPSSASELIPALFYAVPERAEIRNSIVGRTATATVYFEPGSISYVSRGDVVRMRLIGGHDVMPSGIKENGSLNLVHGGESTRWHEKTALYAKVLYQGIYDGIDLVYGGSVRALKSEYIVAPKADPSRIRFQFGDGSTTSLVQGTLRVGTTFREGTPEVFQETLHGRKEVDAAYHKYSDGSIGFRLGAYDTGRTLIIDPAVTFSTYWGGSMEDAVTGVAIGADGSMYICGWTDSSDLPTFNPFQMQRRGSDEGFVLKLSSARTIIYATYLGGSGQDRPSGIAVDSAGNAYIGGWTNSTDFPLAGAIQTQLRGSRDAFIAKLNASGSLVFSTYLGGSSTDTVNAIQVDASGFSYVAGQTTSNDFPIVSAVQTKFGGTEDAFVTKFDTYGHIVYSTYLGGAGADEAYGLAILNGQAFLTGSTSSPNFPTLNAFQAYNQGGQDAFVAKLSSSGSALVYSTYLGGNAGSAGSPESGNGIAVTPAGEAVVVGTTYSSNFPLVAPIRSALTGTNNDAFVSKLSAAGNQLLFSTYFGGSGYDAAKSIAFDPSGNIYIVGETTSQDLQVVSPMQAANAGLYNAFIASLTPDGHTLRLSSYWGGSGSDSAAAVAVDANANVTVGGMTTSWNFPLVNAMQTFNGDNYGGFIMTLSQGTTAAIGDFNHDGHSDLALQSTTTRQIGAWYLTGAGGNTVQTSLWISSTGVSGWTLVGIGDLDHNGTPDLLLQNDSDGRLQVWYMQGTEGNTVATTLLLTANGQPASALGWSVVGFGDMNRDGILDLILQNSAHQIGVWYMSGPQGNIIQSSLWITSTGIPGTIAVGSGDFNKDGTPDLLIQDLSTGHIMIWYMTGAQGNVIQSIQPITTNGQPAQLASWAPVAVLDANRDGAIDIVVENAAGQIGIWYMTGAQGNEIQSSLWISPGSMLGWQFVGTK